MTDKGMFKGMTYESLNKQVDGNHYSNMKIQPAEFINENNLLFAEGNAIKYICRHQKKGKIKDIEKALERDNFLKPDDAKEFGLIDHVASKREVADKDE